MGKFDGLFAEPSKTQQPAGSPAVAPQPSTTNTGKFAGLFDGAPTQTQTADSGKFAGLFPKQEAVVEKPKVDLSGLVNEPVAGVRKRDTTFVDTRTAGSTTPATDDEVAKYATQSTGGVSPLKRAYDYLNNAVKGGVSIFGIDTAIAPESQQNYEKLKNEWDNSLLGQYTRIDKNNTGQLVSGITGHIITPGMTAPESISEKVMGGLYNAAGSVEAINKIGKVVNGLAQGSETIAGILSKYPKVAKYVYPFLKVGTELSIYDQLDPNVKDRLAQLGKSLTMAVPFTLTGMIPNKFVAIPASFGVGYGISRLEGASNEDALINGTIFAALDAAGRFSDKGGIVTGRASDRPVKIEAANAINEFSKTKISYNSSPDEIKRAYLEAAQVTHPDKTGGSDANFKRVNLSYQFLSGDIKSLNLPEKQPADTPKLIGETKQPSEAQVPTINEIEAKARIAEAKANESKVVEQSKALTNAETGKPLEVVGHAGIADGKIDSGFRTLDKDVASNYAVQRGGVVNTFNDKLQNPYVAEDQTDILKNLIKQGDEKARQLFDDFSNLLNQKGGTDNTDTIVREIDKYIKSKLSEQGFDAVVYKGTNEYQLFNLPKKVEPKQYTETSQKIVDIFNQSSNQKSVGKIDNVNFELGSFGENHAKRKDIEGKSDRFSADQLEETIKHIDAVYRASNEKGNYRADNLAWIAKMPNGDLRAIYTRQNARGAEEILSWHNIKEVNAQKYLETLSSFGIPDRTRTGTTSLEPKGAIQLLNGDKKSIPQGEASVKRLVEENTKKIIDTYLSKDGANEELSIIRQEMEIAEPGSRYVVKDEQGYSLGAGSVPSTFPDWIPSELRSTELFNKVFEGLSSIEKLEYPTGNKSKQRELYNYILKKLDKRIGVDTSEARSAIMKAYESNKGGAGVSNRGAQGGAGRTEKSKAGEKVVSKSQKEIVKDVVAEKPKSIKEVSKETGILEPNVRRILGVGAKDGTFERVGEGVYILKDAQGNESAYIEVGDAKDVLARMASEGKKFQSVILDPAYFSRALIGGNRGLKGSEVKRGGWDKYIMPNDFASVMKSISDLVKDDKTHVYLMLSGARTAQPDMEKYVKGAVDAGFKAVGEGSYVKTFKDGSPVTNVRGIEAAPERIILMTKSGEARAGEMPIELNFRFIRPSITKSYQTEKPAELMKALIEQSTLEGETVLDPFAGSGVTGEQAIKTGRKPTLIEQSAKSVEDFTKPRVEKAQKEAVAKPKVDEARKYKSAEEFLQAKANEGKKIVENNLPFSEISKENKELVDLHYGINLYDNNGDIPGVIKKYTDLYNQATNGGKFQEKQPSLIAAHNTTAEKILFADRTGGFANPSLMVGDVEKGLNTGFGDITLIAPKDLLRGGKTFSGDIYSPRYPSVHFVSSSKSFDYLKNYFKEMSALTGETVSDLDFDSIQRSLENSNLAYADFLKKKGVELPSFKDRYEARSKMRELINEGKLTDEYIKYIDKLVSDAGFTEMLFAGYTNTGKRRYLPVSAENASKIMNRSALRDSEGGFTGSGYGSVRASVAKSIPVDKLAGKKKLIVSTKDFEKIKETFDNKISNLVDEIAKNSPIKEKNPFILHDQTMSGLKDFMAGKFPEFVSSYKVSDKLLGEISALKSELQSMPTEYFETKFKRPVQLNEFSKAVIPSDTPASVKEILKKNKIEFVEYKVGDEADRNLKIKELSQSSSIAFQSAASVPENSKFISNEDAQLVINRYFKSGEVGIEFVDKITTPEGLDAFGKYSRGMIQFINNPNSTTPHHEAVHAYLDLFTSPENKAQILAEVKDKYRNLGLDDNAAEERLADDFIDYVRGKAETKSLLRRLFERVVRFLKRLGNVGKVERFYSDISNKVRPDRAVRNKYPAKFSDGGLYQSKRQAKQSALEKIGSRVANDNTEEGKTSFLNFAEKFRTEAVDNVYPLEVLAKKAGKDMTEADASLFARLYNNIGAIVVNNFKTDRGYWSWTGSGFDKLHDFNWHTLIRDLKENTTDFGNFLVARRAMTDYQRLDELQATEAQLDPVIDEKEYNELKTEIEGLSQVIERDGFDRETVEQAYKENEKRFEKETKMYDTLVAEDLKFLNRPEIGLVNEEDYKRLSSRTGYASFKRSFFDELTAEDTGTGVAKTGSTKVSSLISRKGSDKQIINPIMNAIKNHAEALKKGLRQMVYNKVINYAEQFPELFRKEDLKVIPVEGGGVMFPQEKDPTIVMARKDYVRQVYTVHPLIKRTLDEVLNFQNLHAFERLLRAANSLFTKGTTGLYPGFALTNFGVDQITAVAQTRNKYVPIYDALKEVMSLILNKDNPDYRFFQEYLVMGGERQTMVGWQDMSPSELFQVINKEKNGLVRVANALNAGMDILALPSKWSEIATRATEYVKSRKAGKPQVVALEEAGRVTAPFHHIGRLGGGRIGQTMVKSVPFFNPALQVLDQVARQLGTPEGRKRYGFVALAVTAALAGSLMYLLEKGTEKQKQLYLDLQPDELAKFIYLPASDGQKLIRFRIPDQMATFGVLFNMAVADQMMGAHYKVGDYFQGAFSFLPPQLDISQPDKALVSLIPQLFKPAIEVLGNFKDFPRIMPLESDYQKGKPSELRKTTSTSALAVFLGETGIAKKLDLSPIQIDYLLTGYLGRAVGFVSGKPGIANQFKSLTREYYFTSGRRLNEFYDIRTQNEQDYYSLKHNLQKYTPAERNNILKTKAKIEPIDKLITEYRNIEIKSDTSPRLESLRTQILKRLDSLL